MDGFGVSRFVAFGDPVETIRFWRGSASSLIAADILLLHKHTELQLTCLESDDVIHQTIIFTPIIQSFQQSTLLFLFFLDFEPVVLKAIEAARKIIQSIYTL